MQVFVPVLNSRDEEVSLDLEGKLAHSTCRHQQCLARQSQRHLQHLLFMEHLLCVRRCIGTIHSFHITFSFNIWKMHAVLRVTKLKNIISRCCGLTVSQQLVCWKLNLWYNSVGNYRRMVIWALPHRFILLSQRCLLPRVAQKFGPQSSLAPVPLCFDKGFSKNSLSRYQYLEVRLSKPQNHQE